MGARAGREPTAPLAPPDDLTHPGHPAVRRGDPRGAKSREHGSPRAPFRPPGVFGVLATTTTRSCARFRYFIIPRPGRGRGQPATARSGAALAQLGFLERRAAPRRVVREQPHFCDNLRVERTLQHRFAVSHRPGRGEDGRETVRCGGRHTFPLFRDSRVQRAKASERDHHSQAKDARSHTHLHSERAPTSS